MSEPSGVELFWLGVAGAFVSYLVAFILPELFRLLDEDVRIIPRRIYVLGIIMTLMLLAGGLVTLAVDPADTKGAFFTGLGWQGLVKGASEIASELSKPARTPRS